MRYLRLGWVACRCINLCDDSPFAYILLGCWFFGRYFCFAVLLGERAIEYFSHSSRDMTGAKLMNQASTAGPPGAYT